LKYGLLYVVIWIELGAMFKACLEHRNFIGGIGKILVFQTGPYTFQPDAKTWVIVRYH
jgi:hypothetical protein